MINHSRVTKVTGKPFAFVQVPLEQLLAGLRAAELPPVVVWRVELTGNALQS